MIRFAENIWCKVLVNLFPNKKNLSNFRASDNFRILKCQKTEIEEYLAVHRKID